MSHIETRFTRKWLEKELSKRYFKKPYDRFMWWRSYTPKQKPLGTKATFRDKILNGDYEQGPYLMEVELAKHTMNDKFDACITVGGEPDFSKYHQETLFFKLSSSAIFYNSKVFFIYFLLKT